MDPINDCPECGEGLVDTRGGGSACLECGWNDSGYDIFDRRARIQAQFGYQDNA